MQGEIFEQATAGIWAQVVFGPKLSKVDLEVPKLKPFMFQCGSLQTSQRTAILMIILVVVTVRSNVNSLESGYQASTEKRAPDKYNRIKHSEDGGRRFPYDTSGGPCRGNRSFTKSIHFKKHKSIRHSEDRDSRFSCNAAGSVYGGDKAFSSKTVLLVH